MGKAKTNNEFISEANNVHDNYYEYGGVDYINNKTKVCITCPKHGEFWQRPKPHLNGSGCPQCYYDRLSKRKSYTTKEFIEKARRAHGDKYDYSATNYKNSKENIKIKCKKHGVFMQQPSTHLSGSGCKKCSFHNMGCLTNDEFIEKAKKVHGDTYNYHEAEYVNYDTKVNIFCEKHGMFEQAPTNHLYGAGCPDCGREVRKMSSWGYGDWVKSSQISKNFDSYKLYVVECWDDTEKFYKIGITYTTIKERFKRVPYNYEPVWIFESENPRKICELEQKLHNDYSEKEYKPNKKFSGMHECFINVNKKKREEND